MSDSSVARTTDGAAGPEHTPAGQALERMLARQPQALREIAGRDVGEAAARLRGAQRIAFVGTGTSFHAAQLAAWMFDGHATMRARAVEAVRFAAAAAAIDPEEAVVVITHTGETAFAAQARHRVLGTGAPLVSITGPAVEWPEAITTPVREEAETYTVSYTAALAVLARLGEALGATGPGPDGLPAVADRVQEILADPQIAHVPIPARALALVGYGPNAITAREGALKLREGARMLCEGFDAERLLHGFAVPYGPADGLVLIEPEADPDGLVAALGTAAAQERIPVSAVREPAAANATAAGAGLVLAQIPVTVRLQCLAARFAALRGTDPDVAITGAWAEPRLWGLGAPA
jgi:glucosamine--fructose-6-phosphate aminotransferase (isomerizing)